MMQHVIIVLGQCLNLDGSVPTPLLTRVDTAKRLYTDLAKAKKPCKVIVTGKDTVNAGRTEAEVMARLLHGVVPAEEILKEESAGNTLENAYFVGPMLEEIERSGGRITAVHLVTSGFHLPRSVLAFKSVLPRFRMVVEGVPAASGCPSLPQDEAVYGINGRVDAQRLAYELNTVRNRLRHQYSRHILKGKIRPEMPNAREVAEAAAVLQTALNRCLFVEVKLEKTLHSKWSSHLSGKAFVFLERVHDEVREDEFDTVLQGGAVTFDALSATTGTNVLVVAPPDVITSLLGQAPRFNKALLLSFKGK